MCLEWGGPGRRSLNESWLPDSFLQSSKSQQFQQNCWTLIIRFNPEKGIGGRRVSWL